jgi:hypothetical protein
MKIAPRCLLATLLLGTASLAAAESIGHAVMPANKSSVVTTFRAPGATPHEVRLGAVEAGALERLKAANAHNDSKRLEVGIGRDVPGLASAAWTATAGGSVARWHVSSRGAESMRVALRAPSWPREAELRFAGRGDGVVYGPFTGTQAQSSGAAYWSPVLEGDSAVVEVFVPAGSPLPEVDVARVSHLFVSFAAAQADIVAKVAQPCQVNFICRAATDAALAQAGSAVARVAFTTSSGGSAFCTGTLLNSTSGGLTPYFATAGHCISQPAEAASVTTRWNYETATCTGAALSASDTQVPGGAALLYTNTTEDFTLLRLDGSPPAGAVFSGWDSARLNPGEPATGIHHPTGDVKKVSLGTAAGVGKSVVADGNGFRIQWTAAATGFTEQGSSGSGIFSGNASSGYRFRGTLQGGPLVGCSAPVAELYDYYSRFDLNFPFVAQFLSSGPSLGANAVGNPGFESGASSWAESPAAGSIITNDASVARSGNWYAWLGGANNYDDALTATLAVPAGAARLQFWYRVATEETSTTTAFDMLTVAIVDAGSGATLRELGTLSNLDRTSGWVQSPVYDVSAFGNRTVRLRFSSSTDGSLVTSFRLDDITINGTAVSAAAAANQTALWWNPSESGWGINVTHQGDIAFATIFTYASNGTPMWLVMSNGARQQGAATFMGTLYRTTGPAFNANPFTPIGPGNITEVGTLTLDFNGSTPAIGYEVGDPYVSKAITKQVFGAAAANCQATTGSRAGATNYQDLWWNPSESGWGINLTHQGDVIFATLFTYAANGQGLWLVMSAGRRQGDGSYLGELYRTTGPAFNAVPFTPIGPGNITQVGTMRLRFSNGENGTLEYSVDGVNVTKAITRQVFSSPIPACSG